jgi:beta-propeller uncharacterized protein DUF5122
VTHNFFPGALVVLVDGKLLAAGDTFRRNPVFGLVRLNADGSLDESFGKRGKVSTAIDRRERDLVAAGYSWQPSYGEVFALARYDG